MKRFLTVLITFTLFFVSKAQVFETVTIAKAGPDENRIIFVVLGDGYLESQLDKFVDDAKNTIEYMFSQSPFLEYKDFFNVYAVKVPSNVEGASQGMFNRIDNYYRSVSGYGGVSRLLMSSSNSRINAVLKNNTPNYDQVLMLVNTSTYGGSGGKVAFTSMHSSFRQIATHEIGHSFAGLSDEYWSGKSEKPNSTSDGNPETIRWKNWLGVNGIGIYPYKEDPTVFRPHQSCRMNNMISDFCSVCKEAIVDTIYSRVSNIDEYFPAEKDLLDHTLFSIKTLAPTTNTLRIEWLLNGMMVKRNSLTLDISQFDLEDENILVCNVLDTTHLTRNDFHHINNLFSVSWDITNTITGTRIKDVASYSSKITIYPNPNSGDFNIDIKSSLSGKGTITIFNSIGQKVWSKENENFIVEKPCFISLDDYDLPIGTYSLNVELGGNLFSETFIICD